MVAATNYLVLLLICTTMTLQSLPVAEGEPQVPCYFIFGDSIMDNGNNNRLVTQAKVNFPPYGIDFPAGPTGRFSNGRNMADVIAQLLGFNKSIPPFAAAKGREIISGVNYASGSAGIRSETGQHLGARISLDQQIRNHWMTILRLTYLIGKGSLIETKKYLNKCIFTVGMGNNDYLNNYFVPKYYKTSSLYTPEQYAEALVQKYYTQLQVLYKSGARMFGIFPVGSLGCIPEIMTEYGMHKCVDSVNSAVRLFNSHLSTMLNNLSSKLHDAEFMLIEDSLQYPNDINVTDRSCCTVSSTMGKGQCAPNQVPCSNRQDYYFWDAFHPTERVSVISGTKAYEMLSPFYASKAITLMKEKEINYIDQ